MHKARKLDALAEVAKGKGIAGFCLLGVLGGLARERI